MAVDLHLHSTCSDGSDTPAEIVAGAVAVGLSGIALTDHDTLQGIHEAAALAKSSGLRFVGGTELSVTWNDQTMHMLVYFLDPGGGPLQDRLDELRDSRHQRNLEIAEKLRAQGFDMTIEEVEAEAGGGVVGRPHFAGVMIQKGYVENVPEAFERYLGAGRPAYTPRRRLSAKQAISLSRASDAVPVIAHPHTLNLSAEEFSSGFRELVDCGLGGIEAYYGEYNPAMRARIAEICNELGIVATGGSDYHGKYKPHLSIGTGTGDLAVPDVALEQLEQRR
ncbi:MAG: PHP domain-containing protein [bacterium]|nr:PHP domain-containing protein [bacterium]MCP4967595.1 PHP domain-containing protein [bacterium]